MAKCVVGGCRAQGPSLARSHLSGARGIRNSLDLFGKASPGAKVGLRCRLQVPMDGALYGRGLWWVGFRLGAIEEVFMSLGVWLNGKGQLPACNSPC